MASSRKRDLAAGDTPAVSPHAERMSLADFKRLVGTHYGTRTVVFDKALAEGVLELNTANRKINRRKLDTLARQMAAGEFENTGEPIIVSAEGILNNGQHRLWAVVQADAVVEMDVRFGIPRRAFSKTDTGATRTGGDVLTIKGVTYGPQVSSSLRLLLLYKRGLPDAVREFVSNDEIARAYDRWKDISDVVTMVQGFSFPKSVRSTPLYATAYLASRSPGRDKLQPWLYTLATGLEASRDNPAYQLRERLMRGVEADVGTRDGLLERFALMVKSWNLWQSGQTVPMRDFRWRREGKFAEPFPRLDGARLP